MSAAVQTLWCDMLVATLAETGVRTCVVSPGSRSTPLVAALVADGRFALPTIIDERAAAFFALGIARATGELVALACTSGTAAAHYLPAIVEASEAGVPLIAITADRPPELQHCGASQTIDQVRLYGAFTRTAFDLGAPVANELALRSVRRTIVQAASTARGPRPGPVHVNVPLRKPLEPAAPTTPDELALARIVRASREAHAVHAPHLEAPYLAADPSAIDRLAAAIAREPNGIIVAGAMPASFARARAEVFELAARAGYPILAEAGSQLRFTPHRGDVVVVEQLDLLCATRFGGVPAPRLVIRIGAEPVAAGWVAAKPLLADAEQFVLADTWNDPDATAQVVLGDVGTTFAQLVAAVARASDRAFAPIEDDVDEHRSSEHGGAERAQVERGIRDHARAWRDADERAARAMAAAIEAHPRSEVAAVREAIDALPDGATLQLGNSLPIRVVDQACGAKHAHDELAQRDPHSRDELAAKRDPSADVARELCVITQRGAAGIDGLVASAAGATHRGAPTLLVLGDVSFAHDLGGLLAAREARAPLAIVVVDNGGGRIFGALPIAQVATRATFEQHFLTTPGIDPSAIATALGLRAVTAASPAAVASAVASALAAPGVTIIHAPVAATGARDVRAYALEQLAAASTPHLSLGATHG